jgi:hypothetical protein
MTARREQLALGLVLALTLACAAWVAWYRPHAGPGTGAPSIEALEKIPRFAPATSPLLSLERLERRPRAAEPGVDVFGPRTWLGAPRASPKAPPPASAPPISTAPAAPPALPFRYLGRLSTGDERVLFVASGDHGLVLREGDVAEARYRLDRIGESGATFTHLDLGVPLLLSFLGESSRAALDAREASDETAALRSEASVAIATSHTSEQAESVQGSAGAPAPLPDRAQQAGADASPAAAARRARTVVARSREPWVCTAQQANELRDCDAQGDLARSSACKQAAASRYRTCLGRSLRGALPASAAEEQ